MPHRKTGKACSHKTDTNAIPLPAREKNGCMFFAVRATDAVGSPRSARHVKPEVRFLSSAWEFARVRNGHIAFLPSRLGIRGLEPAFINCLNDVIDLGTAPAGSPALIGASSGMTSPALPRTR